MDNSFIRKHADGVLLDIKVTPNGGRNSVDGVHNNRLKIRIQAPPEDGKANEEIIKFFAKLFGCRKAEVEIVKGLQSREKTVLVSGVTEETIRVYISG